MTETPRPRRRLPRTVREQEIIDAAVRVFSQRGYRAAVVDEIAEMAGISKPMVYLYLGSKEGLFVACLKREAQRLVAAFREAARDAARTGGEPAERLWAGLTAFFRFVAEHRDSWVVLHRQAPEQSERIAAELAEVRRSVMAEVAGLVGEGIDAGTAGGTGGGTAGDVAGGTGGGEEAAARLGPDDADFVAHTLVGAADALTDWMERHPDESPERVTLRLMNVVWIGMRNVLAGEIWTPPSRPPES
ncbi:TetR/AcrR family transcriptional regulator [Streptomyces sp. 4N509B]|uniref:TetR/AcrR family transcriptional regulator n=1 Tax=Streptomyces sp. 4N509B TaxID=3457413 RepID=UPI003FD020B3